MGHKSQYQSSTRTLQHVKVLNQITKRFIPFYYIWKSKVARGGLLLSTCETLAKRLSIYGLLSYDLHEMVETKKIIIKGGISYNKWYMVYR